MNTVAIVQARMNSTRLPGKVLREIHGKTILRHVLDRLTETRRVDQIVVATCCDGGCGAIAGRCDDWGVPCYQDPGDENDVLGRMAKAAGLFEADRIVRVCADNPLIHPGEVDTLILEAEKSGADYVGFGINGTKQAIITVPTGYFAEVVTREALDRADREATEPGEREHVTSYMCHYPDRFTRRILRLPKWYRDEKPVKVAIDTEEDLERVTQIMEELANAPAD